jgi:predicted ribosome quality control (RQC) complex YloA/Tae2 family protein
MGPDGPLPVKMGPGHPVADPLAPCDSPGTSTAPAAADRERLTAAAERAAAGLRRRIGRLEEAVEALVPPERYRLWAELLLSCGDTRRRGRDSLELTDWEGTVQNIPLRRAKTIGENASRYFRKARSADREAANLSRLLRDARTRLAQLEGLVSDDDPRSMELLAGLLRRSGRGSGHRKPAAPLELVLQGGWRCLVGRNATDNDRVTFGNGRKGDYWLHARGASGAHVILKMDGRKQKPPAAVLREAAAVAASRSGSGSGVVPVDYTLVQYVRKPRGSRPGQVVYSREKTIFIDLDRQTPVALDSGEGREPSGKDETGES